MNSNVRTFRASCLPEALAQVKRELGPDAVILGTRSVPANRLGGLVGRNRVEITAGPADSVARPPRAVGPPPRHVPTPALPEHVYPHYVELVQNEVAERLAKRLVQQAAANAGPIVDPRAVREALIQAITRLIPTTGGIEVDLGTRRHVAFVGPAGSGKTTMLAKLAAHFKLRWKKQVAILSLDMHRMATNEQLRRYAEIIGVSMEAAQTVSGVKTALKRLGAQNLVLIDTPGIGMRDKGRFARLAALLRAARPDEIHLVLPASTTGTVQKRAAEVFGPLGVSRVALTRLDEVIGLGVILNTMEELNWSLSYVTDGQIVPNDIRAACGRQVAELIFTQDT